MRVYFIRIAEKEYCTERAAMIGSVQPLFMKIIFFHEDRLFAAIHFGWHCIKYYIFPEFLHLSTVLYLKNIPYFLTVDFEVPL